MKLTLEQAQDLAGQFLTRLEKWPNEEIYTSFLVVILNYGDHLTAISCVSCKWNGTKSDLQPNDRIPTCPNGHPLTESNRQVRLGLVDSLYPNDLPASQEAPIYRKVAKRNDVGTDWWYIVCDEGWRSSIVCENMYEWSADWMLSVLERKSYAKENKE